MANPVNTNVLVEFKEAKPQLPPNQIRIRHPVTGEEIVRKFTIYENGVAVAVDKKAGKTFARAAAQIALTQSRNNEMFTRAGIDFGDSLGSLQGVTKAELLNKDVLIKQGVVTHLDGTSEAFYQDSLPAVVRTFKVDRVAVSTLEDYRNLNSPKYTAGAVAQARPAGNPNQPSPAAPTRTTTTTTRSATTMATSPTTLTTTTATTRFPQYQQPPESDLLESEPRFQQQYKQQYSDLFPRQQPTQVTQQGQNIEDANQSQLYATALNRKDKNNPHPNPLDTLVDQIRTMDGSFKNKQNIICNIEIREKVAKELWDNCSNWTNDEQFNEIFKSLQIILANDNTKLFANIPGITSEYARFDSDEGTTTTLLNSISTSSIEVNNRKKLVKLYAKYIHNHGTSLDSTFFRPFVKAFPSFQVVCVNENAQGNKLSYFTPPGTSILPSKCAFIHLGLDGKYSSYERTDLPRKHLDPATSIPKQTRQVKNDHYHGSHYSGNAVDDDDNDTEPLIIVDPNAARSGNPPD